MKVIIAGDRNLKDYSLIDKAVKQSGFKVTTVISGCAQGADSLGEEWAKRHGIKIERYPANWDDLTHPEAIISVNKWGRKYNKAAGGIRNAKMAEVGDALIAIQPNGPTSGTQNMIKQAKKHKLKIHIYEKADEDYEYQF
jgi:hypothetical protein